MTRMLSDRDNSQKALNAVAAAVERVAGELSLATEPADVEDAVNKLLTIASNARSGVLNAA